MNLRDRLKLADVLNERGLTGSAVEIGTHKAEFAAPFLERWQGKMLYLVDPWTPLEHYDDPINAGDRDADMTEALLSLAPYEGRFTVMRMTSVKASLKFASETFDFVYIDANHREPFVSQDIATWYPKVKHGGIFAGHDFLGPTWPDVAKGILTFAKEHGIKEINQSWEAGGSYWIVKP